MRPATAAMGLLAMVLVASCGPKAQPVSVPGTSSPPNSSQTSSPSSSPSPASSSPSSPSPSSPPDGPPRCATSMLSAQLREGSPGAGQRYAWIVLTNTSPTACEIFGYGGMALQGKPGTLVPTDLVRSPAFPPTAVVLKHGESASSLLHWSVVPGVGEPVSPGSADCEPSAIRALVTPPDQYTSLTVPWTFGPVCEHGHIEQRAYAAGTGSG